MIKFFKYSSLTLYFIITTCLCKIILSQVFSGCHHSADFILVFILLTSEVVFFLATIFVYCLFSKSNLTIFFIINAFPIIIFHLCIIIHSIYCNSNSWQIIFMLLPTVLLAPYFFAATKKIIYICNGIITAIILGIYATIPNDLIFMIVIILSYSIPPLGIIKLIKNALSNSQTNNQ